MIYLASLLSPDFCDSKPFSILEVKPKTHTSALFIKKVKPKITDTFKFTTNLIFSVKKNPKRYEGVRKKKKKKTQTEKKPTNVYGLIHNGIE